MKKLMLLTVLTMLLTGCASLKDKTFSAVSSGQGGKVLFTDPSGINPLPTFIGGTYYQSILTVPPTISKVLRKTKTYTWWGTILVDEEIEVEVDKKP